MTGKENAEHSRLQRAWATGAATKKQILRCMELDRKAETEIQLKESLPE